MTATSFDGLDAAARDQASRGVSWFLGLAASPAFLGLAGLTALNHESGLAGLCTSGVPAQTSLGGMAFMYAVMALFHLPPWLKVAGPLFHSERRRPFKLRQTLALGSNADVPSG
jgi:hypothetical protein